MHAAAEALPSALLAASDHRLVELRAAPRRTPRRTGVTPSRASTTNSDDVGLVDGQLGLGAHPGFEALVGDVLEAGGVDQLKVEVARAGPSRSGGRG